MMTINVLAFGIAKEILGGNSVSVVLEDATSADVLKHQLEEQYPGLKKLSTFMIAVNNSYAAAGTVIQPGDEVAIIPPVSGG